MFRSLFLACLLPWVAPLVSAEDCAQVTIDFEEFAAGDIPDRVGPKEDPYLKVYGWSNVGDFPPMIFDTANPTGEDLDLQSDTLGKVLILSEDGDNSDPDDAEHGGRFKFHFFRPVKVVSVDVFDIESPQSIIWTRYSDVNGSQKYPTIPIPPTENGVLQTIAVDQSNVSDLMVRLSGSGAIASVTFEQCESVCYPPPVEVVTVGQTVYGNSADVPRRPQAESCASGGEHAWPGYHAQRYAFYVSQLLLGLYQRMTRD